MNGFLADIIVATHLAYVSFVLFGQVGILLGILLKWSWVRNFWFRVLHLAMICIVALEAIVDFECPLTTWELGLRRQQWQEVSLPLSGAKAFGLLNSPLGEGPWLAAAAVLDKRLPDISGTFIGRCLDFLVFVNWPPQVATPLYIGFALLVILTYVLAPPRRRGRAAFSPAAGQPAPH